jgi:hypothetical protein
MSRVDRFGRQVTKPSADYAAAVVGAAQTGALDKSGSNLRARSFQDAPEIWRYYDVWQRLIPLCRDFGSGAESAQSNPARSTVVYIDPLLGSDTVTGGDSYAGQSFLRPRRTWPGNIYPGGSDIKFLVAAGRTMQRAPDVNPAVAIGSNIGRDQAESTTAGTDNVTISVYNANPESTRYALGEEIFDQPNPFVRALLGGWVTEQEIAERYFTIDHGFGPDTDPAAYSGGTTGEGVSFVGTATSGTKTYLLRGARIQNYWSNGINFRTGVNAIVEDCIIGRGWRRADAYTSTAQFSAVSVRANDAVSAISMARIFIDEVSEDAFWLVNKGPNQAFSLVDYAVRHHAKAVYYGAQHADVFQWLAVMGAVTVRRGVIEHLMPDSVFSDNGNGETEPVGAVCIGSAGAAVTTGSPLFEDLLIVSNRQLWNVQPGTGGVAQANGTLRRVVGVMVPSSQPQADLLTYGASGWTEEDCVWAAVKHQKSIGAGGYRRQIRTLVNGALPPTLTRVKDLRD